MHELTFSYAYPYRHPKLLTGYLVLSLQQANPLATWRIPCPIPYATFWENFTSAQ